MESKHVGIILDGNRRFAKKLMAQPWKGHEKGAEKVENLLDWAMELEIEELTLYAFSMQNFKRTEEEKEYLMGIFQKVFTSEKILKKIQEHKIRVRFLGRIHLFPKDIYQIMLDLMEKTKENSRFFVNFAMAYGGQEEIVDAVKTVAEKVKEGEMAVDEIDVESFEKHLYTDHKPDFIIRTGGDYRTSNFLIWQSAYSEWFFLEKKWPEFEKEDLIGCIKQFRNRNRRFGK
jgi:tritrans,polycis-undecaprenyl-diphosphate synthase [geranylgeranyl-diphosphate specific]